MKFSEALEYCMAGARITREDWNGKNMYVWFVPPKTIAIENWHSDPNVPNEPTPEEEKNGYVSLAGHFDMMNAQGMRIIGWLASQTDMASDQWEIYVPEYERERNKETLKKLLDELEG